MCMCACEGQVWEVWLSGWCPASSRPMMSWWQPRLSPMWRWIKSVLYSFSLTWSFLLTFSHPAATTPRYAISHFQSISGWNNFKYHKTLKPQFNSIVFTLFVGLSCHCLHFIVADVLCMHVCCRINQSPNWMNLFNSNQNLAIMGRVMQLWEILVILASVCTLWMLYICSVEHAAHRWMHSFQQIITLELFVIAQWNLYRNNIWLKALKSSKMAAFRCTAARRWWFNFSDVRAFFVSLLNIAAAIYSAVS